jgi:hypothetical protein
MRCPLEDGSEEWLAGHGIRRQRCSAKTNRRGQSDWVPLNIARGRLHKPKRFYEHFNKRRRTLISQVPGKN